MRDELFEEFKNGETGKKPLSRPVLPDKTFVFAFTYERIVVIALGLVIALAIVFAAGFECGKRSNIRTKGKVLKTVSLRSPEKKNYRLYTIQIASYNSKDLALKEVQRVRKMGFPTYVIGINGKYEIWVGEYRDQKEAAQTLRTVKKYYKDSYIRER